MTKTPSRRPKGRPRAPKPLQASPAPQGAQPPLMGAQESALAAQQYQDWAAKAQDPQEAQRLSRMAAVNQAFAKGRQAQALQGDQMPPIEPT